MSVARFLDDILAAKRAEIAALHAITNRNEAPSPTRDFAAALRRPGLSLIAEIKRRSPSKGPLAPDLNAAQLAADYERGGAAAISCLTDAGFFGARADDLPAARAATTLPVLRKDFLIDAAQVDESRRLGADAVLLIARILTDAQLRALRARAESLHMAVLIEVHDEADLDRALAAGAAIIGVNNRDLDTFQVRLETALRLRPRIPADRITVAESGITRRADLLRLEQCGFDAVLLGETLVAAADAEVRLRELRGACA